MKVTGSVKRIFPTQQVSEKFRKKEFVISTQDQYPQDVIFQLSQDKTDLLAGVSEGDIIEIDFNLRGREWINPQGEIKYFNTLDAWNIALQTRVQKESVPVAKKQQPQQEVNVPIKDDDLPF